MLSGAIRVAVECTPVPAPRPRVMKFGGVYYPKPYAHYTAELQREFAKQYQGPPLEGSLVVGLEIVSQRPKKTVLAAPRGDADNHAKGPLDALTKTTRFWNDDVQITDLIVNKRWTNDGEKPGVRVHIAPLEDTP